MHYGSIKIANADDLHNTIASGLRGAIFGGALSYANADHEKRTWKDAIKGTAIGGLLGGAVGYGSDYVADNYSKPTKEALTAAYNKLHGG